VAATDENVLAVLEEALRKNPGASNADLFEKAKEANPEIAGLDRRQFNARYPLQIKRRLQLDAGGAKPAKPRTRAAKSEAPAAPPRRRGRPPKSVQSAAAPEAAAPAAASVEGAPEKAGRGADRDAIRSAFMSFAQDLVSAADTPKQLVQVLAEVDRYVDQVAKAQG